MAKCNICGHGKPRFGALMICKKCGFIACTRHKKELQMAGTFSHSMMCPQCRKKRPIRKLE